MSALAVAPDAREVGSVATQIKSLHAEVEQHMSKALQSAVRIGKLLAAERERRAHLRAGHGYVAWVQRECGMSQSSAHFYMRCYENADRLLDSGAHTRAEALRFLQTGSIEITERHRQKNFERNRGYLEKQVAEATRIDGPMIERAARALCKELSKFGYPSTPTPVVRKHVHAVLVAALQGNGGAYEESDVLDAVARVVER